MLLASLRKMCGLVCLNICIAGLSSCIALNPEEQVTCDAFRALKEKNWERYKALTITPAEIALSNDGVSPFKRSMTFVGAEVSKEQEDDVRRAFDLYCTKDCLKDADIDKVVRLESSSMDIPWAQKECRVPLLKYKVSTRKGLSDPVCVVPIFHLTEWHGKTYLLGLSYE